MITTLGFSILVELAHHCQGQSPILMLVGLFFLHFLEPKIIIQGSQQNRNLVQGLVMFFEKISE